MEISTCMPHDEHLIVGRKADSLSPDMTAVQGLSCNGSSRVIQA
jgi:hypothetical protein